MIHKRNFDIAPIVDAFRYGVDEAPAWFIKMVSEWQVYQGYDFGIIILDGRLHRVEIGDYIVNPHVQSSLSVVKPDDFKRDYTKL